MGHVLSKKLVVDISNELRKRGKTVVFTHGAFDIFHVGHAEFLKESKKLGDCLIVGVESDERISYYKGKSRPIVPFKYRLEMVSRIEAVDIVVPVDLSLDVSTEFYVRLYNQFYPKMLTCGGNFQFDQQLRNRHKDFNFAKLLKITHKFDKKISTTAIINRVQEEKLPNPRNIAGLKEVYEPVEANF